MAFNRFRTSYKRQILVDLVLTINAPVDLATALAAGLEAAKAVLFNNDSNNIVEFMRNVGSGNSAVEEGFIENQSAANPIYLMANFMGYDSTTGAQFGYTAANLIANGYKMVPTTARFYMAGRDLRDVLITTNNLAATVTFNLMYR